MGLVIDFLTIEHWKMKLKFFPSVYEKKSLGQKKNLVVEL